ncbi:TPA: Rho termination factor N-terminal domain-containing protein [Streptococcus agalactiae]|nr:Rho termination factor N-terminal domain-containing protein [Streptococcus agalactiae]HEM9657886.1 Rho termination factor N-terminal domain-containing protein [Streptococcus agalactiae]HEN8214579.1 Rho termination factor N-terminal domain-containing protein [Streptococcus agalactiae]HEO8065723.1 Rho termination factor N-terminal domain-containing protein [Streptococcus agalactiae]
MAYTVKTRFFDLLDNSFLYEVGDIFPRKGYEPSRERLESLLSSNNAYHKTFISASENLRDMKVTELKEKAKGLGIELPAKANKEEIIELIEKK